MLVRVPRYSNRTTPVKQHLLGINIPIMPRSRGHPLCRIFLPEGVFRTVFYTLNTILVELNIWRSSIALPAHRATFPSNTLRVQSSNSISGRNLGKIAFQ